MIILQIDFLNIFIHLVIDLIVQTIVIDTDLNLNLHVFVDLISGKGLVSGFYDQTVTILVSDWSIRILFLVNACSETTFVTFSDLFMRDTHAVISGFSANRY